MTKSTSACHFFEYSLPLSSVFPLFTLFGEHFFEEIAHFNVKLGKVEKIRIFHNCF